MRRIESRWRRASWSTSSAIAGSVRARAESAEISVVIGGQPIVAEVSAF
jgi:hypothetical protein